MIWQALPQTYWAFEPLRELQRLQRDASRLFGRYDGQSVGFPALNLWANQDEAIVVAEIPGVDPKTVNLTVTDDKLTIEGQRPAEPEQANDTYHRQERDSGAFQRTVRLPFEVESEKVRAQYEHGLLRISLPRKETTKPRKITITSEAN
jgi:HSP20 family protein